MKKTTLGVLILGAGLLLAGCGKQATSGQQSVSVGILQVSTWFTRPSAQGVQAGLQKELKAHNSKVTVKYHYLNAQGDQSNLNTMSQQLVQPENDL
ncbi:hypothetical protein [Lactiplantibacillus plantarum]|uniref:hypothetical protein n=1 Tax=Lactiplantibacillus plantarum TaxID=1590 RepID=UPI0004833A46|nr:hypothetical protein [Lactiplantibacillus plantarum]